MSRGRFLFGLMILILISASACTNQPLSDNADDQSVQFKDTQSLTNEIDTDPSAANGDEYKFLRINHYKAECEGHFVSFCYLVQEVDSDVWFNFYEQIEGFDYQWGNTYEIMVSAESLNSGLADTPSIKYELEQVISVTPHDVAESFTSISRKSHERIVEVEPGVFSHLGMVSFTCDSEICSSLRSVIDQKQSAVLSFKYTDQANARLVLDSILCADAPKSFKASCL